MTPETQWEIRKTKGDLPVFHIYLNGEYFAQTVDEYKANLIVGAFNYGEAHTSAKSAEAVLVYEYPLHLPLKSFPSITRRKLALNDIGEDSDDFTRLGFELKDGDIIQVLRQRKE